MNTFIRSAHSGRSLLSVLVFALAIGFAVPAFAQEYDNVGYGNIGFDSPGIATFDYSPNPGTATYDYAPNPGTATFDYAPNPGTVTYDYAPNPGTATYDYAPTTGTYEPYGGTYQMYGGTYDTYTTPIYGYDMGYGGIGFASLGLGLGFGTSYYPSYSYYPTTTYVPTQTNYVPVQTPVSNPTVTYAPTNVYSPTSVYAPTDTSTFAPTYTSTNVYAPTDSHNVVGPTTVTTDSHNSTTISVVSNNSQAAPQYPVQYVYSGGGSYYNPPVFYNTPTYFPQMPSCVITASASGYNYNTGAVTLSWTSSNANSGYISPLVGTVAPAGSTTVYPNQNTLYTLTVSGSGGTASCQTRTAYQAAAAAPFVALTQIPYTGFDFGTFGNAAYWTLLALFAVAVSYLVVYYRGGALAFVTSMMRKETKAAATVKTEAVRAVQETKHAPVASFRGTRDSMLSVGATDGSGPRIVVLRA